MALKGDRYELQGDISEFANSVMQRGGAVVYQTLGSGGAMDQSVSLVQYANASSGQSPKGILMQDMVQIDPTRQHINYYRDEVLLGGKVLVLVKGYVNTNMLVQGAAPIAVGDRAALSSSGFIVNITQAAEYAGTWNKALNPPVGRFISTMDEDGYAKVSVITE